MEFALTISLPPRGRGTTEVVEGACAIELYCERYQEHLL